MSISVQYHSFSPSRADVAWKNFREDVLANKKGKKPTQVELDLAYEKKAKELFRILEEHDLYVPWFSYDGKSGIDAYGNFERTWTAREKCSYIFNFGRIYRKGVDPRTDPQAKIFILKSELPDVFEKYSILENSPWLIEKEAQNIGLTANQSAIREGLEFLYEMQDSNGADFASLRTAIISIDLAYGGVENEYFDSPKLSGEILEAIMEQSGSAYPVNREKIIKAFSLISSQTFPDLIKKYAELRKNDLEEAEDLLVDFIKSLIPVIKDLKKTEDAIFLENFNFFEYITPKEVEKLMDERARKFWEEFRGVEGLW